MSSTVLQGFHHVKLPVTDVARSRDWYQEVLGLETYLEFVEEGELMGVAMQDPDRTVNLAARYDPERAGALSGFDPVTWAVADQAALQAWRQRLDHLDQPHNGIVAGHQGWALLGLHDPDGYEVRLYTLEQHHREER